MQIRNKFETFRYTKQIAKQRTTEQQNNRTTEQQNNGS